MKLKQLKPLLKDQRVSIKVSINSFSSFLNMSVKPYYGPATNIPNEMLDYTIEEIGAGYVSVYIILKEKNNEKET